MKLPVASEKRTLLLSVTSDFSTNELFVEVSDFIFLSRQCCWLAICLKKRLISMQTSSTCWPFPFAVWLKCQPQTKWNHGPSTPVIRKMRANDFEKRLRYSRASLQRSVKTHPYCNHRCNWLLPQLSFAIGDSCGSILTFVSVKFGRATKEWF